MKVLMFAVREDEQLFIDRFAKKYELEVETVKENLSQNNVHLTTGFEAIVVIGTCDLSKIVLQQLHLNGVKVIASRSAGYDNFDVAYLNTLDIQASRVPAYSPNAISEFALTSALCLIRNIKKTILHAFDQQFSLKGLMGFELRNATVGIVGTGRIGIEAGKAFKALGSRVIGYDMYPNETFQQLGEYVSLSQLFKESDVISLHVPYLSSTHHLINKDSIQQMKNHVVIVNTARGAIVDAKAVLDALETNQIGGYGMDVYEFENGIFHQDCSDNKIEDVVLKKLIDHPNCLVTPHIAFYSDEAVSNMVEIAFQNVHAYVKNKEVLHRIK